MTHRQQCADSLCRQQLNLRHRPQGRSLNGLCDTALHSCICQQQMLMEMLLAVMSAGWGTSFHFAHRLKHETHIESIRRHEHYLALRLGLKPGAQHTLQHMLCKLVCMRNRVGAQAST